MRVFETNSCRTSPSRAYFGANVPSESVGTPSLKRDVPMSETVTNKKYYIDFIDPLFAVVLHISFTHAVMKQAWFEDLAHLFSPDILFGFVTLFLGYLVVIQSWVGYHESVREKPIRESGRFYIDVFLLTAYLLLTLKFENFAFVLTLLVVIFGLFAFWDKLKAREYPDGSQDVAAKLRRGITVFWFFVFLLLSGLYGTIITFWGEAVKYYRWVFLIMAIIATLMYRGHKRRLWWEGFVKKIPVP